jgi:misacylated tRNA(Ala) deacylase
MATECLFRDDAYLKECDATVLAITGEGAIVLDRTVFYATSGGQPGDSGTLTTADGRQMPIATAVYTDAAKSEIAHIPATNVPAQDATGVGAAALKAGDTVKAAIDWDKRYARMRMHTAMHLLSAALPYAVTGGSVGESESRLDFDIPEAGLDKDAVTARLNEMVARNAAVTDRWISDEELAANPGLVKTMSVMPPMGTGRVRLIEIAGLDLQPCGGTHVRATGEIGAVRVTQIEKKGKQNRRVRLALAYPPPSPRAPRSAASARRNA